MVDPETDPVKIVALPEIPVVIVGLPEKITLPPLDTPARLLDPALIITALLPVSDTLILLAIVKFPDVVEIVKFVRLVKPPTTPDKVIASTEEIVKVFAPLIAADIV